MKKIFALILSSIFLSATAFADKASYGEIATQVKGMEAIRSVSVVNYTRDAYLVYATFIGHPGVPEFYSVDDLSGVQNPPYNWLNEPYVSSPYQLVCLHVVRNYDLYPAYNGCLSSGRVNLLEAVGINASKNPIAKVIH